MKQNRTQELLANALKELTQARRHLDYSFQQVATLPATLHGVDENQLASAEAFSSRFARTVDLLVNKVLRSLDRAELLPQGTLLDTVNRAEKRGFVSHAVDLREMKDVRNMIAHDYAGEKAAEILVYCREQKPVLDSICERVIAYANKSFPSES